MKILIAYDGSECADAALEDLKSAGLPKTAEAIVMSLADVFLPPPINEDEIIEEAEGWGADCIFVGAKGMRGVDRLLLGSVSSAVSARANCSVEIVRPKSMASTRT